MRIPISWLKDYVDVTHSPADLADMITKAGMEVEKVDYVGVEGADLVWDRDKVLLAKVIKVEKHPDADKLLLVSADYGADEPKVVVTGAPNLFQYLEMGDVSPLNLYSPIIFEGATYLNPYKDGKPTKLKGKALRGIYNDSMLCSAVELGVGEDHDGIILMQQDDLGPQYVAGTPLQDVLGDAILDVDIIPNIARCASLVGIAREVAALTGQELRYPNYDVVMDGPSIDGKIKISTENPELNPRFVGMLIEGVEQKPSPYWMQHRLQLAGQRPINVVVDISNYVMLEMGQPNHTFDYDFLRTRADQYDPDGPVHIITRLPQDGEKVTTLDGTERDLYPNNILVTDPLSNLSIGGIMGGYDSEIQDATTNVLLEAAAWYFINIRQSGRQLALHTEAGFRFSRGVHPSQALLGAKRAAELLRVLAGGTVANGIVDYHPQPADAIQIDLDPAYVRARSGLEIDSAEIKTLLERLEFTVVADGDLLRVTVPDHRLDVEAKHDLLEEVCRIYGYDNIPTTVLASVLPPQRGNASLEFEMAIKDSLVEMGLYEAITYRLTTTEQEAKIALGDPDDRPYVSLTNPSTVDRVNMRHSVLASVVEMLAANTRFAKRIALFEIGRIYLTSDEQLPDELARLAIAMTGQRDGGSWQGASSGLMDFYDLKGVVEGLFADLNLDVRYESAEHPSFRPGRTAAIYLGNSQKAVGLIGELHPLVVERYDMRLDKDQAILAADIDVETLQKQGLKGTLVDAVPIYPAVREDLALVVDADKPASAIEAALRKAGGFLLKDVELFDVYTGDKIAAGKKSLAYHLTFQSPNKTLKDKDTMKMRRKILGQLKATMGATLRE